MEAPFGWQPESFTEKNYPEFIEAIRDFLNANTQKDSQEGTERERKRERERESRKLVRGLRNSAGIILT